MDNRESVIFKQSFASKEHPERKISLIAKLDKGYDPNVDGLAQTTLWAEQLEPRLILTDASGESFNVVFYEVATNYLCVTPDQTYPLAWDDAEPRDGPLLGKAREFSDSPIRKMALYWGVLVKPEQSWAYTADKPQIFLFTMNDLITYKPATIDAAL